MTTDTPRRPSLGALVARLRQHGSGYVLTSVAHGAHGAALQRTLAALRGLGVREGPPPARSALDDIGVGLVRLEAHRAGDPARSGLSPTLLLIGEATSPYALLLPAVQRVRDAAARTPLKNRYTLFIGDGTPVRPGQVVHGGWIEIQNISSP